LEDGRGILAVGLSDGQDAWRLSLDKPLMSLFRPGGGYVAAGLQGGDVRLVDPSTGEVVLSRRVPGMHGVIRGMLMDGTLLVHGYAFRSGSRDPMLAAVDVATGTELWRREDLGPLRRPDRSLRVVGGRLPVVVRSDDSNPGRDRRAHLATLDVRTGRIVGSELRIPSEENRLGLNGDFEVFAGSASLVAVIGTSTGIHAVRMKTEEPGGSAESTE
jgi:outer membrane protein assembly factor BamB